MAGLRDKFLAFAASEVQRVGRVFVGVDRGSPNGDQPAYTEMEQQPDGSMLVTKCLVGDEARKEIERREARPAVDVEGLAKVLQRYSRTRGALFDWKGMAEIAVEFIGKNGGRP